MKKILIGILVCLMAIIVYGAATESHSGKTIDGKVSLVQKTTVTFDCNSGTGPCDDQTLTTENSVYGYIQRIVILHTATDTAFQVYVKDADGVYIFNKTDCSGADSDYSYVTELEGIPVGSVLTVGIADANGDSGTTALSVVIYYIEQNR